MSKKEEKTEYSMKDFYAQFLIAAQDLVKTTEESKGVQSISPEDLLKIIHHSIAFGLMVSGFLLKTEDDDIATLMVTEHRNFYADQLSQFISIRKK